LALNGHHDALNGCPLLGVKRTWCKSPRMPANDLACVKTRLVI
jgi:hypothetical protein